MRKVVGVEIELVDGNSKLDFDLKQAFQNVEMNTFVLDALISKYSCKGNL